MFFSSKSQEVHHEPRAESSRFSPSPDLLPPPATSRRPSSWSHTAVESATASTPPTSRFRDRFTKFWFDLRTIGRDPDEGDVPIEQPQLREWAPLHIEKRPPQCCVHCKKQRKNRKRRRLLIVLLILVILYLLGNVAALNVRTFSTSTTSTVTIVSSANATGTASTLSANEQLCLSEFEINAPVNATLYPCSSCFSVLQGVPSDYLSSHTEDAQNIQSALQFCGLRNIFIETATEGQSTLTTGGWMQSVEFCGWTGVKCSTAGEVISLELSTPAIPTIIPTMIGGLTSLETLEIVGDSEYPAGTLPSSFTNLTALSTLELQSTGLTELPDDLFDYLTNVTTLSLTKNTQMSSTLPSSVLSLSLESLVINDQTLDNPLSSIVNSTSLLSSLELLDFSQTNLTGTIPSTISSLTNLIELHLDLNDLEDPLPSTFPSKLEVLTLANNTELSGTVTGSFCDLQDLQSCDMEGTDLKAAGSCSVCTFSS